jgi:hypothetical protein
MPVMLAMRAILLTSALVGAGNSFTSPISISSSL